MENVPIMILLADDDESDRLLFKEAFGELKIKSVVHNVNNGMELMNYLTEKDAVLPHIIFLDLNMPLKNGLECLKEIRSNKKFAAIPIAIYSTSVSQNDIEETFLNGANVYIKKPSDFSTLKQLLGKVVSTVRMYRDQPFNIEKFLLQI
jgi:CheY-like chemotaxis protein